MSSTTIHSGKQRGEEISSLPIGVGVLERHTVESSGCENVRDLERVEVEATLTHSQTVWDTEMILERSFIQIPF